MAGITNRFKPLGAYEQVVHFSLFFAHILAEIFKGKNKQIMDQTSKENPNIAAQNLFFFFQSPFSTFLFHRHVQEFWMFYSR